MKKIALIILFLISVTTAYSVTITYANDSSHFTNSDISSFYLLDNIPLDNSIVNENSYIQSKGDKDSEVETISGTDVHTISIDDLQDIKKIQNENYFLINPQHGLNDGSYNAGGTCTTVALQMLLGYHNYYSDRRIIPEVSDGGIRFLDENYGMLRYNPTFIRTHVGDSYLDDGNIKRGCEFIGTSNYFYKEIFDKTWISNWYGIGQAINLVTAGANKVISQHSPSEVRNSISLYDRMFSKSNAQGEIDSGRPVVLGMQPFFTGADSFHVIIAYGYAKYNGVDGFIGHYGWGNRKTQVWIPSSWFLFQVNMNVNHSHQYRFRGFNLGANVYEDICTICNYNRVHIHEYKQTWVDYKKHQLQCQCGDTLGNLQGHIIKGAWDGTGYATCLICKGPVEVGFVEMRVFNGFIKNLFIKEHFGNESYILKNGIIVLSDIDYEKFKENMLFSMKFKDDIIEYSIPNKEHQK